MNLAKSKMLKNSFVSKLCEKSEIMQLGSNLV